MAELTAYREGEEERNGNETGGGGGMEFILCPGNKKEKSAPIVD